ncbi:acyltransferase [Paractinoplanes deccanensis]|uniref:Acyltransferase n=1 Tax=Paractinoplanes deccanensis TaxID=113561 RepID=A0ABQ3YL80_9ACTN|nr:acyltransferase [Actinoplanes deccanensis]GID80757.1 acyltransferase [Actinoplanes deccanensis]
MVTTLAPAPRRQRTRLAALDGLRLICALAVAGYHYGVSWRIDGVRPPTTFLPNAAHLLVYGFLGVEAFFMISGFVIGMSGWDRRPRDFLVARFLRLYPAFWVCVFVTVTVVVLLPVTTGVPYGSSLSLSDVLLNLTMAPQPLGATLVDSVYWTLWCELRFYLVFAVLIAIGLTRRRVEVFCSVWLVAAVAGPSWVMPDYAPYFVGGLALYLLHRFGPHWVTWCLIGASWALGMARVAGRVAALSPGFEVPVLPARIILSLAYGVLIAIALGATRRVTWGWLSTAGALTYPFYLLHQRIGYALLRRGYEHTGLPVWSLIAGTIAAMLGLAWMVHRCAERPVAAWLGRRLAGAGLSRRPAKAG